AGGTTALPATALDARMRKYLMSLVLGHRDTVPQAHDVASQESRQLLQRMRDRVRLDLVSGCCLFVFSTAVHNGSLLAIWLPQQGINIVLLSFLFAGVLQAANAGW